MSIERQAVIVRGFRVDEDPREKVSDDFYDEWVINFDGWDDCGPFLIGYIVQSCSEGRVYELTEMAHPAETNDDETLISAANSAGFIVPEIKTYFGVRIW